MIRSWRRTKGSGEMLMRLSASINVQFEAVKNHTDRREASTSITSSSTLRSMSHYRTCSRSGV